MPRHIIQRQVLELRIPNGLPARPIESEVEFLLMHEVWPKIEAICSRLGGGGETIAIERMEIELDAMTSTSLRSQWPREVCRLFEADLRMRLATWAFPRNAGAGHDSAHHPGEETPGEVTFPNTSLLNKESRLQVLVFFLRYGLLPWWWDRKEANMRRLMTELIAEARPALRRQLRASLAVTETGRRLSGQFDSETVRNILELVITSRSGAATILTLHDRAVRRFPSPAGSQSKPAALVAIESRLLAAACQLAERVDFGEREVIDVAVRHVPTSDWQFRRFLTDLSLREAELTTDAAGPAAPISRAVADKSSQERYVFDRSTGQGGARADSPFLAQRPAEESAPSKPPSIPPPDADLSTEVAGLVLLWPYLERFFTQLELISGNAFRDPPARWRALHLLHFLATGDDDGTSEHALALPKVLCGVSLPEPVPFSVGLTDGEKSEAARLLSAAIKNWPPLKNTSISGFRQAFLQREGRLALPEDAMPMPGWKLRVERKGHDILLDQLPWGVHFVKLPWMPQPLYVEW